ncbi:DUF805 domain-containing protein [Modestobacter versicolor]|uniref:Uncharacterized membrane protein YhaH (DUF805 family) n=1 Tax=Modestobacter versicolor TaxID=429133 RepID=A0A839YEI4_9ACTN|nr:DUF805 domain-containing protein [Modestobacter versicolor]MBB3678193.1 uncharacterized membrane protein YhaH (DUF805 family) [Modestobacter versicolor]
MSFWQWYVRRGRIDRRTWWLHYSLPVTALGVLGLLADVSLGNVDLDAVAAGDASAYGPVVVLVLLLTAPASISASATRLHDRGMPAWWLLLGLVPYVGGLALLVLNGFLPGDAGPNRYGPARGWLPGPAAQPLFPPAAPPAGPPTGPPTGPPSPPPSAPPYWG